MRTSQGAAWLLALGLVCARVGRAQGTGTVESVPAQRAVAAGGIEVTADRLEYEADRKLLVATGHVVVRQGNDVLRADIVTVHTETQDAYATGNVVLERGEQIWRGDELTYNFRTRTGDFGEFQGEVKPYYIRGAESRRVAPEEYVVEDATITTCPGERPGFFVRAKEAHISHGRRLDARHVVVYLGAVPVLYLPYWSYDLGREKTNVDALPGLNSRQGAYLLLAYNYAVSSNVRAATHLDYYSKRGIGFGQDFEWRGSDTNLPTRGAIRGYYIADRKPYKDREEEEARAGTAGEVDETRYRVRLDHRQALAERASLFASVHYLSDPDVLKDFFRREYHEQAEPENRLTLTHRGDRYTAGMEVKKRLNDFYENVDRLPELSLEFPRQPVGDSPFYYEGENHATFLQKVFPKDSPRDDYDVFRADSAHMLYYPSRHFGFFNVIPRAGYQATYYSKTRQETITTNVVALTDTNGVPLLSPEGEVLTTAVVSRVMEEGGADVRHRFELGVETAFKAFRVYQDPDPYGEGGLRHIAEPYANYTFVPEPNLTPDQLYPFDAVDELDKEHFIRFGMRNKLQTKRGRRVVDLVDANAFTDYRLEPEEGQEDFGPLRFDVELSPSSWCELEFDGKYDWYGEGIVALNSQVGLELAGRSALALEHRYVKDSRDEIQGEIVLFPEARWSLGSYVRFDLENSEVQEQSYYVQRKDDCLGVTVGYNGRGDDWDVWIKLWLVAFPRAVFGAQGHY